MTLVKNTKSGVHRVHAINALGKPVCGGGHQARVAEWQTDLAEPNCKRCLTILERQSSVRPSTFAPRPSSAPPRRINL
jgi:hypothetical protein